jgi:hypothetical protein
MGKSGPTASWTANPLPAPLTIAPGVDSVSGSNAFIVQRRATTCCSWAVPGTSSDCPGALKRSPTRAAETRSSFPFAGNGTNSFAGNVLTLGDTPNLKPALAATNWNGSALKLANYLTLTDSATLSVAATRVVRGWRSRPSKAPAALI